MIRSGVYVIECVPTGKTYIGSAVDFASRFRVHKCRLRKNEHHNQHLQSAWNKYGESAFEFRKLLCCAPSDVLFYEQRAIDAMKPEFNAAAIAGNTLGYKFSEEQKMALRAIRQAFRRANPTHGAKVYRLDGQDYTVRQAAEVFGMNSQTIGKRLRRGLSFEDAVKLPLTPGGGRLGKPSYSYEGQLLRVADIARMAGERTTLIKKWLAKGHSVGFILSGQARQRVHAK